MDRRDPSSRQREKRRRILSQPTQQSLPIEQYDGYSVPLYIPQQAPFGMQRNFQATPPYTISSSSVHPSQSHSASQMLTSTSAMPHFVAYNEPLERCTTLAYQSTNVYPQIPDGHHHGPASQSITARFPISESNTEHPNHSFLEHGASFYPCVPASSFLTTAGMQAYQFGAQFPVISQITGYTDLVNGQQMAATNGPRSPIVQTCDASEDRVTVCFGAISSVAGKCDQRKVASIKSPFPVDIGPDSSFDSPSTPVSGTLSLNAHQRQIIQSLLDQEELTLYTMCSIDDLDVTPKPEKRFAQVRCRLDITIYGYVEDAKEWGDWFQQCEMYLQDPLECHWNTRYYNPHKLSSNNLDTCPMVAEVVEQSSSQIHFQDVQGGIEMLDVFSSRQELEEAQQPRAIKSQLQRHQKQALTFMYRREKGWGLNDGQPDIWTIQDTDEQRLFVNMVSQTRQKEEPPQFYGGIVADPMGLGKTLTMIALAASDFEKESNTMALMMNEIEEPFALATLIIVPPPLLGSWEEQLIGHVKTGQLNYRCHHGKTKFTKSSSFGSVRVVLTTYHTVSAEWKTGMSTDSSVLFSGRWRRIILDEGITMYPPRRALLKDAAHYIRNEDSRMSQAVCALDAHSRWAVTGTPIQNKLGDLATLMKFIRVHPYTDTKQFDADLSRLWKSGEDEKAVQRLQYLSSCLLLRRPKTTINLPPRHDKLCAVDFTKEEREIYDQMRQQALQSIETAIKRDSAPEIAKTGTYYVNALQLIESLRLFCNLGLGYQTRHQKRKIDEPSWSDIAQQCFDMERQRGAMICLCCSSILELTETMLDDSETTAHLPQLFQCLKFVCGECSKAHREARQRLACDHDPTCLMAPVSLSSNTLENIPHVAPSETGSPVPIVVSSKVKALVSDIKSLTPGVKSIVFSSWRLTLDVVQKALQEAGIQSMRFDGKVPQKERQAVVEAFRSDPTVSVMLLTLSCGAVGLTLTEASRAYLMEPHWNPNIEEQALARVHRIGQTRKVTTVRLYMRDSFEKQVMEVQDTKKQLAGILLSPHDGGRLDDKLGSLQKLRSLL